MFEHSDAQLSLPFFADRKLVVQRHVGQISSDAGLLPVRQLDQRLRFTQRLAAGLRDDRHEPRHTQLEMLRQRLYGILADYEDCNDHDTLRDDPIFKIVADRLPEDDPLASQPTLSRFENAVTIDTLWQTLDFLVATGIERLREKNEGQLPDRLTLDLDATDDPAHGQQQLALFHGYYEQHQYFPIVISEPTTQHVFYATLRPGSVHAAHGADDDLEFVVERLHAARGDLAIHVRGDSGFGVPSMYKICEKNRLTYTFGIGANKRLQAMAQPAFGSHGTVAVAFHADADVCQLYTIFAIRRRAMELNPLGHQIDGASLARGKLGITPASHARCGHFALRLAFPKRNRSGRDSIGPVLLSCSWSATYGLHRVAIGIWRVSVVYYSHTVFTVLDSQKRTLSGHRRGVKASISRPRPSYVNRQGAGPRLVRRRRDGLGAHKKSRTRSNLRPATPQLGSLWRRTVSRNQR